MILAIYDLQVTLMLPTEFQVSWSLVQEKKGKTDVQDGHHGSHLGFPFGMILAIFDLQVILMLPTSYQVSWPFGSEEGKNRFSRWPPHSDRNEFSSF